VTHLAEQSFWDVIDAYSGPGIASHQNCRALAAGERQFSDAKCSSVVRLAPSGRPAPGGQPAGRRRLRPAGQETRGRGRPPVSNRGGGSVLEGNRGDPARDPVLPRVYRHVSKMSDRADATANVFGMVVMKLSQAVQGIWKAAP